jgi:hypothetical protein
MDLNNQPLPNTPEDVRQHDDTKPSATRVDDDGNADEASLKRNYIIGGEMKNANAPGMEGEGMGGHKFGHENHPPTGDDPANPSRNAGYTNGYLARTEPLQERPEDNNFKAQHQQGEPNYQTAKSPEPNKDNQQEQQNTDGQSNTEHDEQHHHRQDYGSDAPEIPGPNEKPEQQKVGGA